jgi:8-oxo-dGTP pyrophosphatase MutT (NUDIX family)
VNSARAGNIRPASSVLVLRDGPRGVELLLMRRPERDNDFRSGACVFPGGVLDAADAAAAPWCVGLDEAEANRRLGLAEGGLAYFVAALRECFEEVGLLFVCGPGGEAVDLGPHAEALRDWRHRLHGGQATLLALCQAFDWRLDLREMAYFSHWLTPVLRPKRFDTRFFVRLTPPGQQAMPDFGEALELMWLTPDEALDPQRALKLLAVTQRTLADMRGFASARAAYEHARALRGVALHFPRPAQGRDGLQMIIEDHPAYDEIAHLDPDGRGDLRCLLQPGDVTQLSPRLWRVAGERAHAYLVADPGGVDAALVDADASDSAQQRALQTLAHGRVLRWHCVTTAADAPDGKLQAHWPGAADPGKQQELRLGPQTTLRVLPQGHGGQAWLVVEDGIALGQASAGAAALPGVARLAPPQGFTRNTDSA